MRNEYALALAEIGARKVAEKGDAVEQARYARLLMEDHDHAMGLLAQHAMETPGYPGVQEVLDAARTARSERADAPPFEPNQEWVDDRLNDWKIAKHRLN